jgi:hypothetical protein
VRDLDEEYTACVRPAGLPGRAPAEFDPLVRYADFGWLPAGFPEADLTIGRHRVDLAARPSSGGTGITVTLLTASAKGDPRALPGMTPAPAVRGRSAYWVPPMSLPSNEALSGIGPGCAAPSSTPGVTQLCWEYAKDGWATLTLPAKGIAGDPKPVAERIAANLVIGGRTPVKMPFGLFDTSLPAAKLRVQALSVASKTRKSAWQAVLTLDDGTADPARRVQITMLPHGPYGALLPRGVVPNGKLDGREQVYRRAASGHSPGMFAVFDRAAMDSLVYATGYGPQGAEQWFRSMTFFDPNPGVWEPPFRGK